jgi:hypothetical protein
MTTSPFDLIQELLDGELDSSQEVSLYAQLASNAELRHEMRQHLALRAAVQKDRAALVPPLSLTNTVFSGLGFAAPLAGAAAGTAGGGLFLQWLSKFGLPLLSAATAAGITIAVSSDNSTLHSQDSRATTQAIAGESAAIQQQLPAAEQRDWSVERSALQSELDEAKSTIAALRKERSSLLRELGNRAVALPSPVPDNSTVSQQPSDSPEAQPLPVRQMHMTTTLMVTAASQQQPFQPLPIELATPSFMLYPSFMVQLRGIALQGLTPVTPKPDLSWYDNASVAFLYQLSDRSTIGVEIGNEAFPQAFEHERNGQIIRTEQYPTSTWGGIMYRHQFEPLVSNVRPFVQALAGGTRFGPMGRMAGGFHYAPGGPLAFVAGIEGTVATYTIQNRWFGSTKLGFTYGVLVRL